MDGAEVKLLGSESEPSTLPSSPNDKELRPQSQCQTGLLLTSHVKSVRQALLRDSITSSSRSGQKRQKRDS